MSDRFPSPTLSAACSLKKLIRYCAVALLIVGVAGCTSLRDYIHNGFKVGPNYAPPVAPVASNWIDADDSRVRTSKDDLCGWWTVFDDPTLNMLIEQSHAQNLTLREAGFRILAARAQFGFAAGDLFPQLQTADGGYRRLGISDTFFDQWSFGFNLVWELDFWGRFRRASAAAEATLDASVEDYDEVLVTLLADVANNYVAYRTAQERIRLLNNTIAVQESVLAFIDEQLAAGLINDVDRAQASTNLNQSRAALYDLEIQLRQAQNNLCILMGMPVTDLSQLLDGGRETDIPRRARLRRRRHSGRPAASPARCSCGRTHRRRAGRADRHRRGRLLSGDFALRHDGLAGQNFSDLFDDQSLNSQRRSRLSVEPAQLRSHPQQRAVPGSPVPGSWSPLPEHRAAGRPGSGERHRHVPQFAGTGRELCEFSVDESPIALEVVIAQYEAGWAASTSTAMP